MESTPARVIAPRTPATEEISSSRVVRAKLHRFLLQEALAERLRIDHSQPKRTSISAA